ncbi:MAG: hypothetical protein H6873_06545 [Hyphomicrobiaceae bacterium]|nr:hypothetical protein [Hyphomicrobiaceae bacterium]
MTEKSSSLAAWLSPNVLRVLTRSAFGLSLAAILAGCSMGNLMGGGSSDVNTTQLAGTSASQADISAAQSSALPVIATECPPIRVRDGSQSIVSYENNRVGDAQSVQFQAVLEDQSRNCRVSNGLINVTMGARGRVILGPKPATNSLTVPLRFAVERDNVPVFTQVYDIPVTVTPPEQSQEFVKVVDNVAIPYLGGENIVIWVGFDTQG